MVWVGGGRGLAKGCLSITIYTSKRGDAGESARLSRLRLPIGSWWHSVGQSWGKCTVCRPARCIVDTEILWIYPEEEAPHVRVSHAMSARGRS